MSEGKATLDSESRRLQIVEESIKPEKALDDTNVEPVKTKIGRPEIPGIPGMMPPMMGAAGMTGMGVPPGMTAPLQMPVGSSTAMHQQQQSKHIRRAPPSKPEKPVATINGEGVIQLDPVMMLEIELLEAETRAAVAEEKLALRYVQDARDKSMTIHRKRLMLMSKITSSVGIPSGRSIRLVDKEQRLCKIEE